MFSYFKSKKLDIILLQETHSKPEDEALWSREWGGDIWFSHGTTQSQGVAVLINKKVPLEVLEIQSAFEGRFLLLEVKMGDLTFLISNFYAPNEDDEQFFIQAFEKIEQKDNPNMILAGDFNTALDPILDSNCNTDNHKKKRIAIQSYLEMRNLVDIWRSRNPNKYQYTWKRDKLAQTSCRLDYIFISDSLCNRVVKTDLHPGFKSDHWRQELQINMETHPRGPGFWKLNTSYLRDDQFLEELNQVIDRYLWEVKPNITPIQIWEYLKLEVSSFCVEYTRRQAARKNRLIINKNSSTNY